MDGLNVSKMAKCCCGQLALEINGVPKLHGVCNCANCKRRTGSAFGISIYHLKADVKRVVGESNVYKFHNSHKNHDQERHFCIDCGTTLFWYVSDMPEYIGIAGGCFDDVKTNFPKFSASHSNICDWLAFSCELKKLV